MRTLLRLMCRLETLAVLAVLACGPVMESAAEPLPEFPVGFEAFHEDPVYNFQLNRFYTMGYIGHDRLAEAATAINSFETWTAEMVRQAELADAEGRTMEAAFFYRGAEFYVSHDDPGKVTHHDAFLERFHEAFAHVGFERDEVPYDTGALPILKLAARGEPRGTVVIHGGFDSFAEEFTTMMIVLAERGHDVVVFEGPGQGGARRDHGLVFDPAWEKPTSAVLDHYDLDDVTLIGISMGGYLCFRAAAHEPRVTRVIASSVAYDYPRFQGPIGQAISRLFMTRFRDFTNGLLEDKIAAGGIDGWVFDHTMYITGAPTPLEAMEVTLSMDKEFLDSELVTQDVLILTGRNDHMVPFKMHRKQVKALTAANSVTAHVFTEDDADQHCQIGNFGLAVETMADWIEETQ